MSKPCRGEIRGNNDVVAAHRHSGGWAECPGTCARHTWAVRMSCPAASAGADSEALKLLGSLP